MKPIRCAIYTRKSTEEGLEQDFNSIDAQRDACQAFITSQKHEGWIPLEDSYDDAAYSGANLHRPALQRLLADIRDGKVDTVVVYKIDRLTRSLLDFGQLVALFDERNVSFVAVTQQFNTTSSMGRLTLNILLSFAQFEREVTAERIRDKFAASKKKGMWMGGIPPYGYTVKNRKLVHEPAEVSRVKELFRRYGSGTSMTDLVRHCRESGWKTRRGTPIAKLFLLKMFHNRAYLGETRHKDKWYPGEHQAIISEAQWARVQEQIAGNRQVKNRRAQVSFLLRGLTYTADGRRLIPNYTRKSGGKLYRYYLPARDVKEGAGTTGIHRFPAGELEGIVLGQLITLFRNEAMIAEVAAAAEEQAAGLDEAAMAVALRRVDDVWEQLFPHERERIVRMLVRRVVIDSEHVHIELAPTGLGNLVQDFRQVT